MEHSREQIEAILAQDGIEPMAIVGMAVRYPGEASTVSGFWDMINHSRTAHSDVPADRWNNDAWYHPNADRKGTTNVKRGCFLDEDVSLFDAPFFSMTAEEASGMDPMQRIMLEVAYEGLENAGIPIQKLPGSMTSVYCGCFTGDYGDLANADIYDAAPYQATGKGKAMLANRISWFFDLRGSSFTVDTACSSSLYALHLACQSLRLKESKMAIVGGTNLLLTPDMMHSLTAQRFLSPDGVSHAFDSRANGYGRGEGFGSIIIKPLAAALADGDTIRAVIRGSGLNQDGHTPGITMPSAASQADLIRTTYREAGLPLNETDFFQAHGTGTALGDPIELSAIGATFGRARSQEQTPLYVSSVKTNIGHTEGASGLAGVIATVLSLENGQIPANAGWENLNPKLRLDDWRVALPVQGPLAMRWPTLGLRRASVNSFGYGGANAHVILDDAHHYLSSRGLKGNHQTETALSLDPGSDSGIGSHVSSEIDDEDEDESQKQLLFVFSSSDQAGHKRFSHAYQKYVQQLLNASKTLHPSVIQDRLTGVAHTLSTRRSTLGYRTYTTAASLDDLQEKLEKGLPKLGRAAKKGSAIWVFTGQGAHWPTMGLELLSHPVFRDSIHKTQEFLEKSNCEWNVLEELERLDSKRLDLPAFSQPMCTAVQIALVDMLFFCGVKPRAVVGHSSGEIAAAYASGAISHKDAVTIAYQRGIFSAEVKNRLTDIEGAMMAAGVGAEEAQKYLDRLENGLTAVFACHNSPSSVTISGDKTAILQLQDMIKEDGHFARQLRVQTAYHSPHMKLVAVDYEKSMASVQPLAKTAKTIPMFSSVTSEVIDPAQLTAAYWVSNMTQPVLFAQATKKLLSYVSVSRGSSRKAKIEYNAVVEVGPHEALKGPVNQILSDFNSQLASTITYTSVLRRGQDAQATALECAGTLWSLGFNVDISKVNNIEADDQVAKTLVDLPPYPWNHEHGFWHESHISKNRRFQKYPRTDLLGAPVADFNPLAPRWRNILRVSENPWLLHHKIQGSVLFPAAGMMCMAIEAAKQLAAGSTPQGFELTNVSFERGLVIPESEQGSVETTIHLSPLDDGSRFEFELYSCSSAGNWIKHASGTIQVVHAAQSAGDWDDCKSKYAEVASIATQTSTRAFYNGLDAVGMVYGPTFRNMTAAYVHAQTRSAHGTITVPDTAAVMPSHFEFPHVVHPATLDAVFHLLFVGDTGGRPMAEASVPVSLGYMYIAATDAALSTPGHDLKGYTQCRPKSQKETIGTLVMAPSGEFREPLLVMRDFVAKEISSSAAPAEPLASMDDAKAPKRTGQLSWVEDVDLWTVESIRAALGDSIAEEQISAWIRRLCHKEPLLNVLVLEDGDASEDVVGLLRQYAPRDDRRFCFSKCTIVNSQDAALSESVQREIETGRYRLTALGEGFNEALAAGDRLTPVSFDLILAPNRAPAGETNTQAYVNKLKTLIVPGGRIVLSGDNSADVSNSREQLLTEAGLDIVLAGAKATIGRVAEADGHETTPSEIIMLEPSVVTNELSALKDTLVKRFEARGLTTRTVSLDNADSVAGKWVVSLVEAERPFVIQWSSSDLENMKKLVSSAEYILWVTRGGQLLGDSPTNIEWSATTGLLRTLRVEMAKLRIPHLDLSPELGLASARAADVIYDCFAASSPAKSYQTEMEYAEKDGDVLIPRFSSNDSFDREIDRHASRDKTFLGLLSAQEGGRLKLQAGKTGTSAALLWTDDDDEGGAASDLADDEVEVETHFVGLEHEDIDVVRGSSLATVVGGQASGVVTRVGAKVTHLQPGQKAVAVRPQAARMYMRLSQSSVHPVPESIPLAAAASLPRAYIAAYYALTTVARLQPGQSVLIHGANSVLGQAAVQLARHIGAEVFAIVDSPSNEGLPAVGGISAERVLSSSDASFPRAVRRATNGAGVDVVLQTLPGSLSRQAWACVASFGHFIEYGKTSHYASYLQTASSATPANATFATVDMEAVESARPQVFSEIFASVQGLLATGAVGVLSAPSVFEAGEIDKAMTELENKTRAGAVVLDIKANSPVPITFPLPSPLLLDPTATYILSGGLGGIGPSVAERMIQNGARHLVFLSRSGAKSPEAQEHLRRLQGLGCKADAFACDVGDIEALRSAVEIFGQRGWNIRGVVQCAMVLRDSTFENMTYQNWTESVQPKIHGSWNLHEVLPRDLDFFIMLSSVSGLIGNPGQGNYTAGNTYQDGLALYRRSQGLPGTALAVGAVMDVGAFADNSYFENFLDKFEHLAALTVKIEEVMIIVETLMKGRTADGNPVPPLLAMGFTEKLRREGEITSLWPQDRKFDHRIEVREDDNGAGGADKVKVGQLLAEAADLQAAGQVVEGALKANLAKAMTSSAEDIDGDKPLHVYGVDSLKAVEVRNWLFRELKCDVSVFDILSPIPLTELSVKIASQSKYLKPGVAEA
ncbi:Type I Iterative PKS [Diaporthe australafricana]|uniref:Type I Iterative PKS n=1 Tax=Diaporthe australafricana TaxID=127596 RepID=A0ABR3VV96_9PEZI